MKNEIIEDIQNRLNLSLEKENVTYYTDGATDSIVLSINNKYLIKTVDNITLNTQKFFLETYTTEYFQRIVYVNEQLKYICFEFIQGEKFNKSPIIVNKVVDEVYNITSKYVKVDIDKYGYLYDNMNDTWEEFLKEELEYSKKEIEFVDFKKVEIALEVIKKYDIAKYLLHGDFGVHNFIVSEGKIKVIDPMPVIGDYLYDFYFAIFSSTSIFKSLSLDNILSYFTERNMEYKKALLLVVLYIRMSRAHKYDMQNFDKYLELYSRL